jgi:prepilin-type processing-associated H-X9-DG protein
MTSPAKTVLFDECIGSAVAINQPNEGASLANGMNNSSAPGEFSPASTGNAFFTGEGNGGVSTVVKADTGYFTTNVAGTLYPLTLDINKQTGRHTNGANYVMADGHAKWFQPAAVCPGGNPALDPGDAPVPSGGVVGGGDSENQFAAGTEFAGNAQFPNYTATWSPT